MAVTRTIRRSFMVEGVLTNVTTAKLSDPTGTYGVKRNDTDAAVVADATSMANVSTGVYEYSFTEPAAGLSYTAYVEFVYAGATYHFEHDLDVVAAPVASQASGSGSAITLVTMQDAIEHLLDVSYGNASDKGLRLFKRAVRMGYRELMEIHDWRYFLREYVLLLSVGIEGGSGKTCVYDHTGGAAERLVTIAGTTFPSWLSSYPRHGRIEINGDVYEVETYLSTTTCVLSATQNPGADISSTTDWKLYRNTYPAPNDFGGMYDLVEHENPGSYFYIEPEEWHAQERGFNVGGQPFAWTLMRDPARPGGFVIRTAGYPTEADLVTFIYRSRGSDPTLAGDETKATAGTVASTSGSAGITGTSSSFDSTMVDAVLRISASSTAPTGAEGTNPFTEQGIIRAVDSTTSLQLWNSASQTLSGKAYVISSLLDVEPGAMLNALFLACEYHLSSMLQEDTKIGMKRMRFLEAVRLATAHDSKLKMMRVSGQGYGYALAMNGGSMFGNPSQYDFGDNA